MPHGAPAPLLDWARWNGRKERTSATSTTGQPPIWERYQTFIKDNPHVLEEALHLARGKLAAGAKRIGAKALWEELRGVLRVKKGGTFKLDNSYTALMARDLIAAEPRLERVIELRERKTRIDAAIDATTPIKDPMPPVFLEHTISPDLRLVCTNVGEFDCKATIQRLVESSAYCKRAHYVDLVVGTGPSVREAVVNAIEAWQKIGIELVDVVNGIEPELGRTEG